MCSGMKLLMLLFALPEICRGSTEDGFPAVKTVATRKLAAENRPLFNKADGVNQISSKVLDGEPIFENHETLIETDTDQVKETQLVDETEQPNAAVAEKALFSLEDIFDSVVEEEKEADAPTVVVFEEPSPSTTEEADEVITPTIVIAENANELESLDGSDIVQPTTIVIEEEDVLGKSPIVVVVKDSISNDDNEPHDEETVIVIEEGQEDETSASVVFEEPTIINEEGEEGEIEAIVITTSSDSGAPVVETVVDNEGVVEEIQYTSSSSDNRKGTSKTGGIVFVAMVGIISIVAVGTTVRSRMLENQQRQPYTRVPGYDQYDKGQYLPL